MPALGDRKTTNYTCLAPVEKDLCHVAFQVRGIKGLVDFFLLNYELFSEWHEHDELVVSTYLLASSH